MRLLATLLALCTALVARADPLREVQAILAGGDVHTVESFLAHLSPDLRGRYVLLHRSRSTQAATPEAPRVILYSREARLVLAFNGARAEGGDRVEILTFDDGAFTLRELEFQEEGAPILSAPNPDRCLACHEGARPLWDSGPFWPGAYGERYGVAPGPKERAGLERFLSRQPADPRYGVLEGLGEFTRSLAANVEHAYQGARDNPNAALGEALGREAMAAVARELWAAPGFDRLRFAALLSLSPRCGVVEEVLPASTAGAWAAARDELGRRTDRANAGQTAAKISRLMDGPATRRFGAPEGLLSARLFAEVAVGQPTRAWTLELEKDTYGFPNARAADWLAAELAQRDPELTRLLRTRATDPDAYCSVLRRGSGEALASVARPLGGRQDHGLAQLLERCDRCHASGVGPYLPLGQPGAHEELREQPELRKEIGARLSEQGFGHMPLDGWLSRGELVALRAYLAGESE